MLKGKLNGNENILCGELGGNENVLEGRLVGGVRLFSGQGTENLIESISVNGEKQPIEKKNVNIIVPTKTSDLKNDSNFVTTDDIPTKVSDLDNDSKFVNEETLERTKEELKKYADDVNTIESITFNGNTVTPTGNKEVILTEADPTVPAWAKESKKPTYKYSN